MSPQTIDLASFDITIEEFCWQAEESTIKLTFAVDQCRFITTCSASILGGKLRIEQHSLLFHHGVEQPELIPHDNSWCNYNKNLS